MQNQVGIPPKYKEPQMSMLSAVRLRFPGLVSVAALVFGASLPMLAQTSGDVLVTIDTTKTTPPELGKYSDSHLLILRVVTLGIRRKPEAPHAQLALGNGNRLMLLGPFS